MGAGHDHGAKSLGEKHRYRLWIALAITVTYMLVQIVAGLMTNSLALLSDAAHMGTDALGTGMALAAIIAVGRAAAHPLRTFGLYRLEVLAALANTVLLFGVAIWVGYESIQRFSEPPEVASIPLLIVASFGLIANLVSLSLLRSGAKESLNVRGAYFEVMGDLLGSIGVIAAAIVIATTGWYYADPIIAMAMAAFILPRAAKLGRDALRILLQTAPAHLDLKAVTRSLADVDGVEDVHDLHVWTLTSGMDVASAHLSISADAVLGEVLAAARQRLETDYDIKHATLQVEPSASDKACEQPSW
ncbi:cation diffusion facilitator family transporter [Stackebrandtia nassauensis]|uniref:Cation diffusion facilitator family transporter n=1 Tax=Stackebrandtia nassauensis (strain DSM 44728 / CIP 108903 / NRRL B-16338 / NBRC 102104 / LLR-40K-21) TaxID=446470 RepID=D3Q235_STANL|nr:cation diffusion facilitator family transporter [Stackebrandtia nassauensis]ADD41902.1 cation diffusion facilitator family transporter [Stackebrandtia nassauensis DSM 44728]